MIYANDEDRSVDLPIKAIVMGIVFIIVGRYLMDIGNECCQFLNLSIAGRIFVVTGILLILLILVLILRPFIESIRPSIESILGLLFSQNNLEAVTY
jgi:sulfite exporter TauE/SafE